MQYGGPIVPGQSEITDLNNLFVADETISCRQVPVYDVVLLEILHAAADLEAHVEQLVQVLHQNCFIPFQILHQGSWIRNKKYHIYICDIYAFVTCIIKRYLLTYNRIIL